ncbi:uncharacterized protein TNCV_3858181 [Trichonephila clavipes]|nr:uncharacterized protein TNCV_3858181 [Trichonephila clavipes]
MWFQQDGEPAHFGADGQSALNTEYPGRWIGRGGPSNWPARSPDLCCLDFFWGHIKSLVYASPVDSDKFLFAIIAVVAGEIREMFRVFANVQYLLHLCWWELFGAVFAISQDCSLDPMTVSRIFNPWVQDGNTERRAGYKRPPITSSREDRHVTSMALVESRIGDNTIIIITRQ